MKYPSENWDFDMSVTDRLRKSNIKVLTVNDFAFLEVHSDKTVEVPVQDTRTKRMVHMLATNMRKMTDKYPQLREEMTAEMREFYSQELIDLIEVEGVDRLV